MKSSICRNPADRSTVVTVELDHREMLMATDRDALLQEVRCQIAKEITSQIMQKIQPMLDELFKEGQSPDLDAMRRAQVAHHFGYVPDNHAELMRMVELITPKLRP